ncbi:hypothetical protein BJF90_13615 [Pseudonocardia sp. CNS-004]|nr:hypothetical protein BJF90_13615 [Pseudonocardia sp. CNS-004]
MTTIRAVLVGVGAMNAIVAHLLAEKGVEVVGAVGRSPEKVGRDAGEVMGLPHPLGVEVAADAGRLYDSVRPDIALVATSSFMADQYDVLATCARHGVNAITIGEEMLFPWHTAPERTGELDGLAREHGVTLAGGGFQDFFLVNQVAGLLGAVNRFDRLVGRESFNVDDYGAEVARDQRIGTTPDDFAEWQTSSTRPPSFALPILAAIASSAGLTITASTVELRPDIATVPIESRSLATVVEPGLLIGFTTVDTVTTGEGPILQMELSGHIYRPGETDRCEWAVQGDPDVRVVNPDVDTLRTTCTQMVNRVADVINAAPGFVTPADLPPLRYRLRPLNEYVLART